MAVKTDVSSLDSANAVVERTVERFAQGDALIDNAAIFSTTKMKPFEEISRKEWDKLMAVNLTGAFLCCQAAVSHTPLFTL